MSDGDKKEQFRGSSLFEDQLFSRLTLYGGVLYVILALFLTFVKVSPPKPDFYVEREREAKLVPLSEDLEDLKVVASAEEVMSQLGEGVDEGIGDGSGEGSGGKPKEVGARGVLGILTGLGVGTRGDAVEDILGAKGLSRDLDKILAGLDGLQRGGVSTSHLERQSASSTGGGIDALMGDVFVGYGEARLEKKGGGKVSTMLPIGGEKVRGARTLDEINKVVQKRIGSIEYCYNSQLKIKPNLQGKITISFIIRSNGVVDKCTVISSTVKNPTLENCIKRNISRWRFIAKEDIGDVEVVYPLVFFPKL
jgi:TonB family protein